MAETKSASRSGSKLNLNESTMPLLDEEAHEKAETPEKDAIELKEKASTTSEAEKDDSNPEKVVRLIFVLSICTWRRGSGCKKPKKSWTFIDWISFWKVVWHTFGESAATRASTRRTNSTKTKEPASFFLFLSRVAQFGRPSAGFRVKNLKLIPPMECQVDPTPFSTVCVSRHWRRAFYSFLPLLVAS